MPLKYVKRRMARFFIDRVLGVHDTAHRIALGVAIGVFVAMTPTMGFQMLLTVAIAAMLRANKVVGLPFAWISNPATLWIYVPSYVLGSWMLQRPWNTSALLKSLERAFSVTGDWDERWDGITSAINDFLMPLWLGSILVGLVAGVVSYVLIYRAVREFRRRYRLRHGRPHPGDEPDTNTADAAGPHH
jgi:uncharacterized protein (DUF2062 family)